MLFSYFITHALFSFWWRYLRKGVLNIPQQMVGQVNAGSFQMRCITIKTCSLVHVELPAKVSQPVFLTFHE